LSPGPAHQLGTRLLYDHLKLTNPQRLGKTIIGNQVYPVWLWWIGPVDDVIADSQSLATGKIVFAELVHPEEAIDTALNQGCDAELRGKIAVPRQNLTHCEAIQDLT
jgi:hypothetical protein